jgi:tellurium resistance protein TerD
MIRADNTIHDYVSYFRLTSGDGSVHLNGDDVTGTGDGDDELIDINLTTINAQTDSLILLLTAYTSGSEFGDIANLQSRLYIDSVEYLLYNINTVDYPSSEHATAALVLEIYKNHNDGGAWYLRTVDIWTTYLSDGSRIYRADNPNL